MIHIESEMKENGTNIKCKIEGNKHIIGYELDALFDALLKDKGLTQLLLKVIEDIMNKGDAK